MRVIELLWEFRSVWIAYLLGILSKNLFILTNPFTRLMFTLRIQNSIIFLCKFNLRIQIILNCLFARSYKQELVRTHKSIRSFDVYFLTERKKNSIKYTGSASYLILVRIQIILNCWFVRSSKQENSQVRTNKSVHSFDVYFPTERKKSNKETHYRADLECRPSLDRHNLIARARLPSFPVGKPFIATCNGIANVNVMKSWMKIEWIEGRLGSIHFRRVGKYIKLLFPVGKPFIATCNGIANGNRMNILESWT